MQDVLTKLFGTQFEREIKKLQPLLQRINDFEKPFSRLSNPALQAQTARFKERLDQGESLDALLPEAFAVCREASRRILNMRHYDVQLIGGVVLHRGQIAEMKTGEGKTLVATLPVYLNGLSGKGAHLVTVNDYLAKRDREWMGAVYHFLGLSTGTIIHDMGNAERQKAYRADVTYGTNNEFGFDYLRDNMKLSESACVQRGLHYAIVDECDSILIDEARTPLIISGAREQSVEKYYAVKEIIPHLKKDIHFTMEEKSRTVSLTEEGNSFAEELLKIENLYDIKHIEKLHNIYQSLKAHHLYKRDVDYMVRGDEIVIVDEFTGRLMPGRRWSEGLHQAVEVKEGVGVKTENRTLSTITFQNYFRMYEKLAGMTGTAETEAKEFKQIYKLDVKVIPTNEPIRRTDHDDVIYKTEEVKYKKIAEEIKERAAQGQPVLVGTVSIEKSERLSLLFQKENIAHKVLNAKHHEREAEIVAQAGRKGAVTIATNMAGRGTDIILGGNPEFMARAAVQRAAAQRAAAQQPAKPENESEDEERRAAALKRFQAACLKEKKEVIKAGGLLIVGTERHESRRVDNQLRGRSGRQGDPGESLFFLSLEDDLMRVFGGERMKKAMNVFRMDDDLPLADRLLTKAVANAQRKVEGHNFEVRKHLLDYDDVMNQQRKAIFRLRRQILRGEGLERLFLDRLSDIVSDILDRFANENARREEWNLPALQSAARLIFNIDIRFPSLEAPPEKTVAEETNLRTHLAGSAVYPTITAESVTGIVKEAVKKRYEEKKQRLKEHFEPLIQMVFLHTIDERWREHLENIDHLREGINLRSYGQKDPLIEYKKESFSMFERVNLTIAGETAEKIFKIELTDSDSLSDMKSEEEEDLVYEDPAFAGAFSKAVPDSVGERAPPPSRDPKPLNRKQRRLRGRRGYGSKKHRIKI